MEELLLAIIAGLLEFLCEAFAELIAEFLASAVIRALRKIAGAAIELSPLEAISVFLIAGAAAGGISFLLFPHPLVPPSRLHGVSILVSPLLTGATMSLIGQGLRKRDKDPTQMESFGYGFTFAFAMAVVRFLLLN